MRRALSRAKRVIFVALLFLPVAGSVSIFPGQTWQILDADGRAMEGAYVAYYFLGREFHVVEYGDYERAGRVACSDREGRIRIPWAVHIHLPFPLQTSLTPFLDVIYVPQLHNVLTSLPTRPLGPAFDDPAHLPGCCVIDRRNGVIRMENAQANPYRREQALWYVAGLVSRLVPKRGPHRPEIRSTATQRRELIAHLRREYETFLAAYANEQRVLPPWPPRQAYESQADYEARMKQQEEARARAVFWGPYLESQWKKRIEELQRLADLK